ncbi:MAG: J domain-containing protein [Acidimicrobiia bacterium]
MASERSHYEELGVAPTATPAEIRAAYVALARRHHPDRLAGRDEGERTLGAARMARVNAAWTVLSDPAKRAAYDARRGLGAGSAHSNVRDPGTGFTPLHDDDDVDPRLLDDTPTGAPTLPRAVAFVPVVLAAVGAGAVVLGALLGFGGLLIGGFVLLACSGLSFLALPFLALINASRSERK